MDFDYVVVPTLTLLLDVLLIRLSIRHTQANGGPSKGLQPDARWSALNLSTRSEELPPKAAHTMFSSIVRP